MANIRRLKNILRKHLPSTWKLETRREKQTLAQTWERCYIYSVNIRRLKNILRKHLPSLWKLETRREKHTLAKT